MMPASELLKLPLFVSVVVLVREEAIRQICCSSSVEITSNCNSRVTSLEAGRAPKLNQKKPPLQGLYSDAHACESLRRCVMRAQWYWPAKYSRAG
jgi:hypothetical protein